jgi:cytochrome P450
METTGNTMAWALYNISIRPTILAGVEAELDSLGLLKTHQRPVSRNVEYDDLNKLVYLNACIKVSKRSPLAA